MLCFLGFFANAQKKYIQQYQPLADSLSRVSGIPTKVILAIAVIESGSGTSKVCKLLNNHFGIVGPNNVLKTHGVKTRYKQYEDGHASYLDFARLITRKKYYETLKGEKDEEKWVTEMSKHGYSEVPAEWRKEIMGAIRLITPMLHSK